MDAAIVRLRCDATLMPHVGFLGIACSLRLSTRPCVHAKIENLAKLAFSRAGDCLHLRCVWLVARRDGWIFSAWISLLQPSMVFTLYPHLRYTEYCEDKNTIRPVVRMRSR